MNRSEECAPLSEIGRRYKGTDQSRCLIGQNISIHIGGEQDIIFLRAGDEIIRDGVYIIILDLNGRVSSPNLSANIEEESVAGAKDIGLVYGRYSLAGEFRRIVKSKRRNPLAPLSCQDP